MLGPGDEQEGAVLRPRESVDEQLEPGCERKCLARLLAAERNERLGRGSTRSHVAPGDGAHRHIRDEWSAVARRDSDRQRARARQRLATLRVREAPGERGGRSATRPTRSASCRTQ